MSAAGGRSSEAAVRSGSDGNAKRLRKVQAPVTCERPQRFAADGATVRSSSEVIEVVVLFWCCCCLFWCCRVEAAQRARSGMKRNEKRRKYRRRHERK